MIECSMFELIFATCMLLPHAAISKKCNSLWKLPANNYLFYVTKVKSKSMIHTVCDVLKVRSTNFWLAKVLAINILIDIVLTIQKASKVISFSDIHEQNFEKSIIQSLTNNPTILRLFLTAKIRINESWLVCIWRKSCNSFFVSKKTKVVRNSLMERYFKWG